jgi:hypothetical protein
VSIDRYRHVPEIDTDPITEGQDMVMMTHVVRGNEKNRPRSVPTATMTRMNMTIDTVINIPRPVGGMIQMTAMTTDELAAAGTTIRDIETMIVLEIVKSLPEEEDVETIGFLKLLEDATIQVVCHHLQVEEI